jgi:hypothetical protein
VLPDFLTQRRKGAEFAKRFNEIIQAIQIFLEIVSGMTVVHNKLANGRLLLDI